jgi:hypothetical protein
MASSPAVDTQPSTVWDFCIWCGGEFHSVEDCPEQSKRRKNTFTRVLRDESTARVVVSSTLRPIAISVYSEHEPDPPSFGHLGDIAALRVPDAASKNAKLIAKAITNIASRRLTAGWSLTYILRTAALGRDMIVRQLEQSGTPRDRKTVAHCLVELVELGVLRRTGQLPDWTDPNADGTQALIQKSGAYLYALNVTIREIGARALEGLISSNAALGGTVGEGRAHRCLKWSVENAQPGVRNHIGHWLANRCTDAGLTEDQAQPVMESYCAQLSKYTPRRVPAYTCREAMATLRSVYRKRQRP